MQHPKNEIQKWYEQAHEHVHVCTYLDTNGAPTRIQGQDHNFSSSISSKTDRNIQAQINPKLCLTILTWAFPSLRIFLQQYYNFKSFLVSSKFLTGEENSSIFLPCFIRENNYVNQQFHASIAAFSFLRKNKLYCNAITVLINQKNYLPRYMPKHSATCTS